LLISIPWSREIAEAYSRGVPAVEAFPDLKEKFQALFYEIERIIEGKGAYVAQSGVCR